MRHNSGKKSWKEAWMGSPGPKNPRETGLLLLKGILMGTADIIPGVSGGTIALITGIYNTLIDAIRSFDMSTIKHILSLDFKSALFELHLRFLIPLFFGILSAILVTARLIHYVLAVFPEITWAFFFGLIVSSTMVLGRQIKNWVGMAGLFFIFGALGAFFLVGMIPVTTPLDWWFIIFSGMIAICAMILPGISGAFILLILGKYEYVTGALKNPFLLPNLKIILLFTGGCLIGITSFSRILSFFLHRYENLTLAFLTGMMFGSLRKIWPWKEVLEEKMIRGKLYVVQETNILPQSFDSALIYALVFIVLGFLLVLILEKTAGKRPVDGRS
ncbi:MAG: DUF368 domain-containing protein [Deltaproteobacteria bacterium]|nr:DUF368 domain-containing protein [Deltaproteobacteria bacterium]